MTVSVHNPDQFMASLRQIIAQGRKRLGLLVGAGAPAGINSPATGKPLIPVVAGMTEMVLAALSFADAHISSLVDEALVANPSASVFAFQFRSLEQEAAACGYRNTRGRI
jgi:hypothetical protein